MRANLQSKWFTTVFNPRAPYLSKFKTAQDEIVAADIWRDLNWSHKSLHTLFSILADVYNQKLWYARLRRPVFTPFSLLN